MFVLMDGMLFINTSQVKVGNGEHSRNKPSEANFWPKIQQFHSSFSSAIKPADLCKATPLIAGRYYGICIDMDGAVLFLFD